MSELKNFKITKTKPGNVLFLLHPVSNPELKKVVHLTGRRPSLSLPLDWALGVFLDDGIYNMYREGYFTFSDNNELARLAYEHGVCFDDKLDFTPAQEGNIKLILDGLKLGQMAKINALCNQYGDDAVKEVAISNVDQIPTGVITFLEKKFNVQLIIDGE